MSRVGRQPIPVPSGVDVKIDGGRVSVKGPKGQLEGSFDPELSIESFAGYDVVLLLTHLACADEHGHALNARQPGRLSCTGRGSTVAMAI